MNKLLEDKFEDLTLKVLIECASLVKQLLKENIIALDEKTRLVVFNNDEANKFLEQQNLELKEQNEFLIKRENKLQQIEMMFKNRNVDLEELSKLILEGNNE